MIPLKRSLEKYNELFYSLYIMTPPLSHFHQATLNSV